MMCEVAGAAKRSVESIQIKAAQAIAGPHCRVQRMLIEGTQARGLQWEELMGSLENEHDAPGSHSTR